MYDTCPVLVPHPYVLGTELYNISASWRPTNSRAQMQVQGPWRLLSLLCNCQVRIDQAMHNILTQGTAKD